MKKLSSVCVALASLGAGSVFAQNDMQLPKEMKGRWSVQSATNNWSLLIDKVNADGSFDGKVSYSGQRCNARDEAVKNGIIKGEEIRFVVDMGSACPGHTFALKKAKGHLLEGEVTNSNLGVRADVYLDAAVAPATTQYGFPSRMEGNACLHSQPTSCVVTFAEVVRMESENKAHLKFTVLSPNCNHGTVDAIAERKDGEWSIKVPGRGCADWVVSVKPVDGKRRFEGSWKATSGNFGNVFYEW